MLTHVFTLAFVLMGQAAQPQTDSAAPPANDPSQMSLADRARAARAAAALKAGRAQSPSPDAPPPLTPEQRGTVRGNEYINDLLHFRINLAEWSPLNDDRVSLSETMARKYVDPDQRPSPYRVLWVGDRAGRTMILSIVAVPPDAPRDLDQLAAGMKRVAVAQLARAKDVQEHNEPLLLGDPAHKFAAFRVSSTFRDMQIVQSEQLTLSNGFLLGFVITGRSDQDVSDALRSLKASLAWTSTAP